MAWGSSTAVDNYELNLPNYGSDDAEFLLEKVGAFKARPESQPFTIVEIGAGTGKFTRVIIEVLNKRSVKNVKIIATDPVEEMCAKFRELLPTIEILQRSAHDLGLSSNSADAVLAVACVRYFSDAESFAEILRVLKPKGILGILCRLPDISVSWIDNLQKIVRKSYKEENLFPQEGKPWRAIIEKNSGYGPLNIVDKVVCHNPVMDLQGILKWYKCYGELMTCPDEAKREAILAEIASELKSHPETKDKETYIFRRDTSVEWVQKV